MADSIFRCIFSRFLPFVENSNLLDYWCGPPPPYSVSIYMHAKWLLDVKLYSHFTTRESICQVQVRTITLCFFFSLIGKKHPIYWLQENKVQRRTSLLPSYQYYFWSLFALFDESNITPFGLRLLIYLCVSTNLKTGKCCMFSIKKK